MELIKDKILNKNYIKENNFGNKKLFSSIIYNKRQRKFG